MRTRLLGAASVAAILIMPAILPASASAQTNPGWFVPAQPAAAPAHQPASPRPRTARPVPVQAAPLPPPDPVGGDDQQQQQAQQPMPPLPQPPIPALPPIPKGVSPPTVIVGVLGVPDVMRQSNAAQIIEKVIGARKEKLRVDVEHAQASWRELAQSLQNDAPKLTPDVGRARERALRERVDRERKELQDRNRIIQEAGQVGLGQIERTLVAIIREVAESRGMNLVLHRSQVALNVQELDITDAVVLQLNKVLRTVQIPPENVDPATLPKDWGTPPAGATPVATAPAAATPAH